MRTPIKFISLSLRNFQSYGNNTTTIALDFTDPTLIVGRNLDDAINGQIDSNGSGKTTLINALSWALYDKPISKISHDKLINNINRKNMEVTMIFHKNGKYYKVIRYRKNKALGDNGAKIYESDSLDFADCEDKAPDSIAAINKYLVDLIGMPFDIFSRIIIYSATSEPFFSLPVTSTANRSNQSDIIEELCGITELSAKGEKLNETLKNDKKELESLIRVEEQISLQKRQYSEKIDSIIRRKDEWNENHDNDIRKLQNILDTVGTVNFQYQLACMEELNGLSTEVKDITNDKATIELKLSPLKQSENNYESWDIKHHEELKSIDISIKNHPDVDYDKQRELFERLNDVQTNLSTLAKQKSDNQSLLDSNKKKNRKIAEQLEHLSNNICPFCLQQFKDVGAKVKELNAEFEKLDLENSDLILDIQRDENNCQKLSDNLHELKGRLQFPSLNELRNDESAFNNILVKYEQLKKQANPYVVSSTIKSDISNLERELIKVESILIKKIKKIDILKGELLYQNEVEIHTDMNKVANATDNIGKLREQVNPHLETLDDLGKIVFDNSNSKKIDDLQDVILHKQFLYKLLTKKDSFIRKSLLNRSLPFLNQQLKRYLDELGMPHKVQFMEDLTTTISRFGNVLDFDNLSSGQQARVNLALSFAFRDVLQLRYGKIQFCLLDECLDVGLGTVGVQMAAKLIKNIAVKNELSMFIISHRDETANIFPNVMEIELNQGFSRVLDSKLSETIEDKLPDIKFK